MRQIATTALVSISLAFLVTIEAAHARQPEATQSPENFVAEFYGQVVIRHPLGNPVGDDLKVFSQYLSQALLHRIDLNFACQADWNRKHPDPNSKPPFLEHGLFTGDDLRAYPHSFSIEESQTQQNHSEHIRVKLTHNEPGERPWVWHVVAVLVQENGRLVLDDVIYLRDFPEYRDVRLSEYLAQDCDGARWIGDGEKH